MVSFELGREIEKDFFVLPRAWGKGKMRNRTSDLPIPRRTSERGSEDLRLDSSWRLKSFSFSHARDKTKNIFL